MKMGPLSWIAFILTVIGGLNWGLIGAFDFDLVATVFGTATITSRVIYVLVGLGALWLLIDGIMKASKSSPASVTQM